MIPSIKIRSIELSFNIYNAGESKVLVDFSVSYYFRKIVKKQKNECAYEKVLEVLFSEYFVLSYQADCLSEASYLFDKMSSIKYSEN